MLCNSNCPRGLTCEPISNIISDCKTTFVCIGYHDDIININEGDIFRHCFKSATTDTMLDYDHYDLKSVMSVMAEALLIDELKQ